MRKVNKQIGVFIIAIINFTCVNYVHVAAAETLSSSGGSNKDKILLGIAVLCIVTFLIILKRVIYAKRNN